MKNSFRRFGFGASIVTVIVCLVLITGSTFSLFTGGDNGDVIVNAANVEVSVAIGNLKLYSKNVEQTGTTFQNGGTADADKLDEGKLELNNMSPMDKVTFDVEVTNKSTINTVYRVKINANGALAEALVIDTGATKFNYGVTDWISLSAATSASGDTFSAVTVSVEFPNGDADKWIPEGTGDNKYEGKSCTIDIAVEAVQANADVVNPVTYDAATNTYYINSEEGMMMIPEILASGANAETAAVESGVVAAAYTARSAKLNIVLKADMDMSGFIWTPVSLDNVNFNGNGKKISNLDCGTDDAGRSAFIGSAKDSTITGVTFENVKAAGAQTAAVIAVAEGNVEVSAVAVAGKVDLSYDNTANPAETSNAIGVIVAVGAATTDATVVTEAAELVVKTNGMKTDISVDEMDEIVKDAIENDETAGDMIFVENGLEIVYEGEDKILYCVSAEYAKETLTADELADVTVIGNSAFAFNNNVKEVILPSTVRALGRGFDSSAVEKVVLNEGLEQIDSRAFRSTTALKEVVFSSTVKTICDDAFQKTGIKRIVIPETVELVGTTAFGASLVETVVFEGSPVIENKAFRGCKNLRTVHILGEDVTFKNTVNQAGCWFCNSESNNPNTSNITFYVQNAEVAAKIKTAMGAEANNTPVYSLSEMNMISEGLYKDSEATNTYYVLNADGLVAMNAMMADRSAGRDTVVRLLSDIDFSDKVWTTVDSHADTGFEIAEIDGNGFTIYNLTINGQGMFRRFAGTGDVVIKDIAFDGAVVTSSAINTSILTVQSYQNVLLDNVDVKNSTITGGYKVAVLIGTVYNENPATTVTATIKDCDIDNCVVKSTSYDFGTCGFIGFVYEGDNDQVVFENSSISNTEICSTDNSGYYSLHAFLYFNGNNGEAGCINEAEGVIVNNCTFNK